MIEFTVQGQPRGKARPRVITAANGVTHAYTPQKTLDYEAEIQWAFRLAKIKEPFLGALRLEIIAFQNIPTDFNKEDRIKALSGELRPMRKPDADNIAKIIADALNGLAYKDDNQIAELSVIKYYALEPYVKVKITELCLST